MDFNELESAANARINRMFEKIDSAAGFQLNDVKLIFGEQVAKMCQNIDDMKQWFEEMQVETSRILNFSDFNIKFEESVNNEAKNLFENEVSEKYRLFLKKLGKI